jgi:hypothetical protein
MYTTRGPAEVQVVGMFKTWVGIVDKVNTEMKKKGGALHRGFNNDYEEGEGDWEHFDVFVHSDRLDPHCTWLGEDPHCTENDQYEKGEGGMKVAQVQHNDRPDRFGTYTLHVHRALLG